MAASPPSPDGRRTLGPFRPSQAEPDTTGDDSRALVSLWVAAFAAILLLGSIGLLSALSFPVGVVAAVMGRRAGRTAVTRKQVKYARAALWIGAVTAVVSLGVGIAWLLAFAGSGGPGAGDEGWRAPAVHAASSGPRHAQLLHSYGV